MADTQVLRPRVQTLAPNQLIPELEDIYGTDDAEERSKKLAKLAESVKLNQLLNIFNVVEVSEQALEGMLAAFLAPRIWAEVNANFYMRGTVALWLVLQIDRGFILYGSDAMWMANDLIALGVDDENAADINDFVRKAKKKGLAMEINTPAARVLTRLLQRKNGKPTE